MSPKPKIVLVDRTGKRSEPLAEAVRPACDVEVVPSLSEAAALVEQPMAGVLIGAGQFAEELAGGDAVRNAAILQGMPDAVALLDSSNVVLWANRRLLEWAGRTDASGENFYALLGSPEILGPDYCPIHTALATQRPSNSIVRSSDNRYFQVHAAVLPQSLAQGRANAQVVVTVSDVTEQMLQQQKLAAIHRAGVELANLTPEELSQMSVDERIELLKSNILHYTKDLLNFDVVEIRLLDSESGRLDPLLAVGLTNEAVRRDLFASTQENGVTGFVAATGKSYLCEDTTADPLYLEGCAGAKSSLTVPLLFHDEVIGTFNVESPEPRAFTETDLQFLEIFSRDVAAALNTLELLVAEKATTALESVEAIHSAVALPVDDILNDAVNVMERYIGLEPQVVERLQNILKNARDIKQLIQRVGQRMTPAQALPQSLQADDRAFLAGKRILVADADGAVRSAAHNLLERYGCTVETAHDAAESICMVRNSALVGNYDVIIADIRLPDMSGYELLVRLQEILDPVPLVLMTGFGYDPGHSIVKARQAGLPSHSVLYKPFRLDQLLETVERVVQSPGAVQEA